MDTSQLIQQSACEWEIAPFGKMRVPAVIYATEALIRDMDQAEMDAMLRGGARWAVERGYGTAEDLDRIEEHGCMAGANPDAAATPLKEGLLCTFTTANTPLIC